MWLSNRSGTISCWSHAPDKDGADDGAKPPNALEDEDSRNLARNARASGA
jgi:hypothetical protein